MSQAAPGVEAWSEDWVLDNGARVTCRPIRPEDAGIEQAFVRALSADSRYSRFMGQVSELTPEMLERFTHNHYPHDFALIVTVTGGGAEQEIAVARYITLPGTDRCEYAIAVADEWQHHGIGQRLMRSLMKLAREGGLRYMEGYVLSDNRKMLELMASLGFESAASEDGPQIRRVWRPL